MRIPATRISLLLCALCGGLTFLRAQSPDPTGTQAAAASSTISSVAAPTNAAPSAPAPAGASAPSDAASSALDYLFNRKPQDGSAAEAVSAVGGNVGNKMKASDALDIPGGLDDPVVRQRFEIYLRHPEVARDRIRAYADEMRELSEMLKRGDDMFAAWKRLYVLSEYQDLDAGISRELANRVEAVWNTVRTNDGLDAKNDKIQREVDTSDRNADLIAEELRTEEQEQQARVGADGGKRANPAAPPTPDSGGDTAATMGSTGPNSPDASGSMELTAEYLRGLEGRARIKLNEVQQDSNLKQAESDFADYITTLYGSRRYYQVIIAAAFYRRLFDGGDYPVAMADQVNASLEIDNNVSLAADDFRDEAGKGQIAEAATMLQTAFLGNEFHPALQGIPLGQKKQISEYLQKLDVLKNMIEVRDFGRVEELVAEIRKIAVDFDATKPMAMVNAVKLESALRLGKARLLAQQGNLKDAMDEFQAAAEAWPGNPDLHDSATDFFSSQDLKTQSVTEFDRLVQEQNYRAISNKQLVYAPAISGDAQREEQLNSALGKVQKAELASEKANGLVLNGDVYGAWETIQRAVTDWPDDNELNKQLADLAGRAADFVAAVNKAREAEARKNIGYSLTWYLNAQHIYPPSVIANEGIDRLSKALLSSDRAGGVEAN
jgi:tetratricopeptide (TPR) repeat protein